MAVAEDFMAAPAVDAPAHGELKPSVPVKLAYSLGQFIESGYIGVSAFIFFYYTAVLGLSGGLVGAALAVSMVVDAFMDPLIGSLSDNVRSKYGRRLPLMVLGGPLMALSVGMLFGPPLALAPFLLFGWLTISKLFLRGFASLFNLPYFALGAEMTDGYVERSSIVAYRTVAGIVIGLVITVLAYNVFFAGPDGLQDRAAYPRFGWAIAAVFFAGAAICTAGVWHYGVKLPQPTTPTRPLVSTLLPEVVEIFRNRSFRTLFLSALIAYVAAGLNGAFNNHSSVFVWKVTPGQIQMITYAYLAGITLGVPLTPVLLRFMEKRSAVVVGLLMLIGVWCTLPVLRIFGLFTATGAEAMPWLMANLLIGGIGIGFMAIAYPSMMADAADEHEVRFGSRREGLYFAGLGFASKAATGLGSLVAGIALDLMDFPTDVAKHVGETLPEPLQRDIMIAWGPAAGFLVLISTVMLIPYGITRARHDEISAELKVKRAADVSAGRSS